jgi:hypothetical protein
MNALIIAQRCSNIAIGVGLRPITRTALSPRPMPMTMRPPEMSCSVAWAEAVTAGSRVTGLVTHMPMRIVDVRSASSVISGYGSCQRIGES